MPFGLAGMTLVRCCVRRSDNVMSAIQAATGLIAAVVSTLVMIQGVALIVLEVRARRPGRPSVLGPH